jgi:hypothetical protein
MLGSFSMEGLVEMRSVGARVQWQDDRDYWKDGIPQAQATDKMPRMYHENVTVVV